MACKHRFLGKHISDSLLPNWQVKHLFIGTYNPEWDRPAKKNAAYFYGRSRHFWNLMKAFFANDEQMDLTTEMAMFDFSQNYSIGFSDLISSIDDADVTKSIHRERIYSVKDSELNKFTSIDWNTTRIIDYLSSNSNISVYFTLLSGNRSSPFSREIEKIEDACKKLRINYKRLHSPTGRGIKSGSSQINKLIHLWSANSTLPKIDLSLYPTDVELSKHNTLKKTKEPLELETISVDIEDLYKLFVEPSGKAIMVDLSTSKIVKTLPTLINSIIPMIARNYGHVISLTSDTKNKTPKNTRTLAKDVFKFYTRNSIQDPFSESVY